MGGGKGSWPRRMARRVMDTLRDLLLTVSAALGSAGLAVKIWAKSMEERLSKVEEASQERALMRSWFDGQSTSAVRKGELRVLRQPQTGSWGKGPDLGERSSV